MVCTGEWRGWSLGGVRWLVAGWPDGDACGAQGGEDGAGGVAVEPGEAGGAGAVGVEAGAFGEVEVGPGATSVVPAVVVGAAQAPPVGGIPAAGDPARAALLRCCGLGGAGAPRPGVVRRAEVLGVVGPPAALHGAGPCRWAGDRGGPGVARAPPPLVVCAAEVPGVVGPPAPLHGAGPRRRVRDRGGPGYAGPDLPLVMRVA